MIASISFQLQMEKLQLKRNPFLSHRNPYGNEWIFISLQNVSGEILRLDRRVLRI